MRDTDEVLTSALASQISDTSREVGERRMSAGDGRTVVLRRSYDAPIEDVWDAITSPERINRWFLPISGDLRLGGRYKLEGNAGGEILRCEPPRLLAVTWVFADNPTERDITEVEVRLSAGADGQTLFELEHAAVVDPGTWSMFGPGAVGVGWDLSLLGLSLYLLGGSIEAGDRDAWVQSSAARDFMTSSSVAWGAAAVAAGAGADQAASAIENTTKFYVPDVPGMM